MRRREREGGLSIMHGERATRRNDSSHEAAFTAKGRFITEEAYK